MANIGSDVGEQLVGGEVDLSKLLKLERKEDIQMAHVDFPAENLERMKQLMPKYGGRFALVDIT